jgi:hypothetical protein
LLSQPCDQPQALFANNPGTACSKTSMAKPMNITEHIRVIASPCRWYSANNCDENSVRNDPANKTREDQPWQHRPAQQLGVSPRLPALGLAGKRAGVYLKPGRKRDTVQSKCSLICENFHPGKP